MSDVGAKIQRLVGLRLGRSIRRKSERGRESFMPIHESPCVYAGTARGKSSVVRSIPKAQKTPMATPVFLAIDQEYIPDRLSTLLAWGRQ